MGLAASQARLLSITRRISDNELRAQLINNEKMRLATESSRVSENYITALNSTNMMFSNYAADNSMQTIPLTYNALTSFNQYNNQYVLSDVAGCVFLREDEAMLYAQSNGDLEQYLNLHGIEYTTTFWDVVGANIADNQAAVNEAAVIRAWYEVAGRDAITSVSGIENCSMFPTLFSLAERINSIADAVGTESSRRARLIDQAVKKITINGSSDGSNGYGGYSNMWFNPHEGNDWLNVHDNNGDVNVAASLYYVKNAFMEKFINLGLDENPTEFTNIYTALWCYGNNKPLPNNLNVADLPAPWNDRLADYEPFTDIINLDTYFNPSSHATIYNIYEHDMTSGNLPSQAADYMFVHFVGDDTSAQEINDTLQVRTPNGALVTVYDNTYCYGNGTLYGSGLNMDNFIEYEINGQLFYGYIPSGDGNPEHVKYYFPSPDNTGNYSYQYLNENYGGGIIVADSDGSFPDLSNIPDRQKANTWVQELIKKYLKDQLTQGGRIESPTQYQNFLDMGFTEEEIEIINNPNDDMGFNELVREFFDIFLGTPNDANEPGECSNNWSAYINTGSDGGQYANLARQNACRTINEIVNSIKNLKMEDLTSTAFETMGENAASEVLSGIINNYEDYQNILSHAWATMSNADGSTWPHPIIRNSSSLGEDVMVVSFTDYGDETTNSYGHINYHGNADFWQVQSDLQSELIYYAAAYFFSTHGMPVYGYIKNGQDATAEAEWYTNLFNKIEECGYKTLEKGLASSTDWMRYALENGIGLIEQLNPVNGWNKITYNSCSDITEETCSQQATLAEAQYNKAMNQIQAKDERFDLELKNIDTEHASLQQEYESVKKAMEQNVQRTFKLYS